MIYYVCDEPQSEEEAYIDFRYGVPRNPLPMVRGPDVLDSTTGIRGATFRLAPRRKCRHESCCPDSPGKSTSFSVPTQLLFSCKKMSSEFACILYTHYTFAFHDPNDFAWFISETSQLQRRFLRRLIFCTTIHYLPEVAEQSDRQHVMPSQLDRVIDPVDWTTAFDPDIISSLSSLSHLSISLKHVSRRLDGPRLGSCQAQVMNAAWREQFFVGFLRLKTSNPKHVTVIVENDGTDIYDIDPSVTERRDLSDWLSRQLLADNVSKSIG